MEKSAKESTKTRGKPKKVLSKIDLVLAEVRVVSDRLKSVEDIVENLQTKTEGTLNVPVPEVTSTTAVPMDTQHKDSAPDESAVPFPREWREVIDEVLNQEFKASVNYRDDARFELTVWVPKHYSNATDREWKMNNADRRIKVIENYMAATGVRDFCTLIAENLGSEIRAKINDARARFVPGHVTEPTPA